MSYYRYPQDEFQNYKRLQLHEMEDLNSLNCLNLRDTQQCMDCISEMKTDGGAQFSSFGKSFRHLTGDVQAKNRLCSAPYKTTTFGDGDGFNFPFRDTNFSSPRRMCSFNEHRQIKRCLDIAQGSENDSDNVCLEDCIPSYLNLQRVGVLPDPDYRNRVVPACVPYSDADIRTANAIVGPQIANWEDLEPIPDNYLELIIKGCGAHNSRYNRLFKWDDNRHLCTNRLKISEQCEDVSASDFEDGTNCDLVASEVSPHQSGQRDSPLFQYALCESNPGYADRCRTKTNTNGTPALCSNHLRKCSFSDWEQRVREEAGVVAEDNVWCYDEPEMMATCSNTFFDGCRDGEFPMKDKFFDPLCGDQGCNENLCCYRPRCITNFDQTCPSDKNFDGNRVCLAEECTEEECCFDPH